MKYDFIKNNFFLENDVIKGYINQFKDIMEYDEQQDYSFGKEIIKESKNVYDKLVSGLKLNKKCKEGLISNVNIQCI